MRSLLRSETPRTGTAGARLACGSATLHVEDTPRPSGVSLSPIQKPEEASRKMERRPKQLRVRLFDREMDSTRGIAPRARHGGL